MDSTTTFLTDLPPLKRHRLIHQQQQKNPSPLPAKKRKESRNSSNFLTNHDVVSPSPTAYPLPTKKRVHAFIPQTQTPNDDISTFDLNVEYKPSPNHNHNHNHKSLISEKLEPESEPSQEDHAVTDDEDQDEDEDGILCCVCQSTDGDPADPIVFCDGCDLMVHASCYGNPLSKGIPDGDWFCDRCRFGERSSECRLCPAKEGAMKRTTEEGGWAHVVCALIVPEVFFADPEGRDGIDCSKVPRKRWSERCYVCGCGGGCAVVCSEPKCGLAFHATCALKEQLCIEYKEDRKGATIVAGFCKTHSLLWEKQQLSGKYKIVAIEDKKK